MTATAQTAFCDSCANPAQDETGFELDPYSHTVLLTDLGADIADHLRNSKGSTLRSKPRQNHRQRTPWKNCKKCPQEMGSRFESVQWGILLAHLAGHTVGDVDEVWKFQQPQRAVW